VGVLGEFVQQYKRKAQKGVEPNDRSYSREIEGMIKQLRPEELSELLTSESHEVVPSDNARRKSPVDPFAQYRKRKL
jgi:hypothetical protein